MVKVVAIIQVRTNSTRLPNKIFKNLPFFAKETLLSNIVLRLKEIKEINNIVIATTSEEKDDVVEEYCKKNNILFYRGSEKNVLERYYETAKYYGADVILRMTGDNPIIDVSIIRDVLSKFLKDNKIDYLKTKNLPLGMGVEIFNFKSLEKNYKNSILDYEKEHVTPYFYKTNPKYFNIIEIEKENSEEISNIRLTVDCIEDYIFICCLFDELYLKNKIFGLEEIKELKTQKPWIFQINNSIEQKRVCNSLEEEIEEAIKLLNKQDLNRVEKYLKEKYYEKDK